MIFTAELPLPPSTNMMFINSRNGKGRGRFLSPAYKAWKRDAAAILMEQWRAAGEPMIDKPYAILIAVNVNHQSDIFNREKAITDLLVSTIPDFPDDCWINQGIIERDRTVEAARVEVTSLIEPIGGEA